MKTKGKGLLITTIAALFIAAFLGGCRKDKFVEYPGICPLVISTNPANLAIGVPLDKIITVTFNEPMNPLTITPEAFTIVATAKGLSAGLAGALSFNASNQTMSFVPTAKLTASTTYSATISALVKDQTGNALQVDYVWTFSTGKTLAPTIVSTDPENNETGVFLNKEVRATFNQPMDPLAFSSTTFIVMQGTTLISGTVSLNGSIASFKPSANLIAGTIYTAKITATNRSLSGTTMANDYLWNFTTGTILAPSVTSSDPAKNASGVALNKVVTVVFSEAMNASTISATSFTLLLGLIPVSGTVSYIGTTATFTPTSLLLSGNTYTATISSVVKNVAGTPIANDFIWNFNTVSPLGPVSVVLNSVSRFGIIAGVGVSNNAGASVINNMDVGIYPGVRSSITGFPPAIIVNGAMYASDDIVPPGVPAMLLQAKNDLVAAYLFAEGATSPAPATVSGDQGGKTLAPGIYKSTSTLLIQLGDLTLDAQGDANAVWIFQIASAFTTIGGAGGNIILTGGAQAKNVYWQTGSSASIGTYTAFNGNILALQSITMGAYSTATGRMLARNGSVVMTSTNTINKP